MTRNCSHRHRRLSLELLEQRQLLAASDFVVELQFDELSGGTAFDTAPDLVANDGTLTSGASFVADGQRDRVIEFDGIDDLVVIDDADEINSVIHDKRTIAFWFRADDATINSRKQVLYEEGGFQRGLNVYLHDSNLYVGGWNVQSTESQWLGSFLVKGGITSAEWHHVALTLQGGDTVAPDALKGFFDGELFASAPGSQLWPHNSVGIGHNNGNTVFHDGQASDTESHGLAGRLDDLQIHNRVLGESEIAELANPDPLVAFDDFSDVSTLVTNGQATSTSNVLRLTQDETYEKGSAFYQDAIDVLDETSFQTQFQFRIHGNEGTSGADGMVFMVQNDPDGLSAIGKHGIGMGYLRIENSIGVDFDTYLNEGDISDNHVSVMSGGDVRRPLASAQAPFDLNNAASLSAWIDFDGATDSLDVYLSDTAIKPATPLLTHVIDLTTVVGPAAYIGFSAGTGASSNMHDIESWRFILDAPLSAPSNGNPVAVDDTATVAQDSGDNQIDVLGNDSDPDQDPLLITAVTQGSKGIVSSDGTSITYTPNAGLTGSDTFTYTISDGLGGIDSATVDVSITPADPGTLSLKTSNYTAIESDGQVAVEVIRTGGSSGTVTIDFTTVDGSAVAASDYSAVSGTLTLLDGETTKSILVPITNDDVEEPTESFNVSLDRVTGGAALGAPRTATITILDDDSPTFTVNYPDFSDTSAIVFNGAASGTSNVLRLTDDLTYAKGSAFYQDPIEILDDTSFQTQFQFRIHGTEGTDGADGMVFIIQNDAAGANALGKHGIGMGYLRITNSLGIDFDTFLNEGDISDNHVSVMTAGHVRDPLVSAPAPFDLNSGTSLTAWIDYDGSTNTLEVYLSDDSAKPVSPLLTHQIDLQSVVGSTGYIGFSGGTGAMKNIHDVESWQFTTNTNQVDPTVEFSQALFSVDEDGIEATVDVVRSGISGNSPMEVQYSTSDGSAEAGADYLAASGTLVFDSGEFAQSFTIPILVDTDIEGVETVSLALSSPVNLSLGQQSQATLEIDDHNEVGSFSSETIVTGLSKPTAIDFTSGDRMFIAQQNGIVRIAENNQLLPEPFVDLQDEVNFVRDRGLLGMVAHPEFPDTPYVYLAYTYDPPEAEFGSGLAARDEHGNRVARVTRVTADPAENFNKALPQSEIVLVGHNSIWQNISSPDKDSTDDTTLPPSCDGVNDCIPTDSQSHTIAGLEFGLDGSLYIAVGDGASYGRVDPRAVRVQDLDSLSGKILRVDPATGEGYADNPFFNGDLQSDRSRVYGLGLRNPFRFAIDPVSGEPYIGDVGWTAWEEINSGRGENFGWPFYEGGNGQNLETGGYKDLPEAQAFYDSNPDVKPPVWSRAHSAGAVAIVAGDFYTGASYPSIYRNSLFFTDFGEPTIRALSLNSDGTVNNVQTVMPSVGVVVEMTMGPDGNVYYADLVAGVVGRIIFST